MPSHLASRNQARMQRPCPMTDRRGTTVASDGKAALDDAMAALDRSGCAAALDKLGRVGTEFAGQPAAASAMWEAARCHEKMGEKAKATELYQALRDSETYGERAKGELAELEQGASPNTAGVQAAGGSGGPAAAAARSAPAKAASKATADSQGYAGPPGGANAAPAPAAAPKAAAPEKATDAAF